MLREIDHQRRLLIGGAILAPASSDIVIASSSFALAGETGTGKAPPKAAGNAALGPVDQIDAGDLNIGYVDLGPRAGPVTVLLHGWPYDIHSFAEVAPLLAGAGHRVIVPYLRGYGSTRFRSSETPRNAQQSVVAVDVINLMNALKIDRAVVAGCDWVARTADILAALWPARCRGLVSVSGYLIGNQEADKTPLPPAAELQW